MTKTVPHILNTNFYIHHAHLLCSSYERWTGKQLLSNQFPAYEMAIQLFHAPFALVSHGTEVDPIFNFGDYIVFPVPSYVVFNPESNKFYRYA